MADPRFLKCSCTHCGGHIEFPDEAVGVAVNCPHCGKETVLSVDGIKKAAAPKKGKGLLVAVVILVVAVVGAGAFFFVKSRKKSDQASSSAESTATTSPAAPSEPKETAEKMVDTAATRGEDLQLLRFDLPKAKAKGSSIVYVQGTVTNQAKVQYFSVKVEFDLFNAKGEKVGIAKDQLANLAPRAGWNFRALVVSKDVTSAKLASLKGEKE